MRGSSLLALVACLTLPNIWTTIEANQGIPCIIEDDLYQNGDRVPDACNRCWCLNGRLACTENLCIIDDEYVPVPVQKYVCQRWSR